MPPLFILTLVGISIAWAIALFFTRATTSPYSAIETEIASQEWVCARGRHLLDSRPPSKSFVCERCLAERQVNPIIKFFCGYEKCPLKRGEKLKELLYEPQAGDLCPCGVGEFTGTPEIILINGKKPPLPQRIGALPYSVLAAKTVRDELLPDLLDILPPKLHAQAQENHNNWDNTQPDPRVIGPLRSALEKKVNGLSERRRQERLTLWIGVVASLILLVVWSLIYAKASDPLFTQERTRETLSIVLQAMGGITFLASV